MALIGVQNDLEEDPMLRQNVNIYRDKAKMPVDEDDEEGQLSLLRNNFLELRISLSYPDWWLRSRIQPSVSKKKFHQKVNKSQNFFLQFCYKIEWKGT